MGDGVAEGGLPVADPREAERRLWAAFGRGVLVDLRVGDPEADNPAHADRWDESRRVRAEVVVALLLGAVDPVAGCVPKIRLAGALVEGSLDIRQGIVGCAAELTGCRFADGLLLGEARTHTLDFSGSVLETVDALAAKLGLRGPDVPDKITGVRAFTTAQAWLHVFQLPSYAKVTVRRSCSSPYVQRRMSGTTGAFSGLTFIKPL
jgi:hypothetical protein